MVKFFTVTTENRSIAAHEKLLDQLNASLTASFVGNGRPED
jgi:hypothetical protein